MKKSMSLCLILLAFLFVSCGQPSVGQSSVGSEGPTWQEQYDLGLRYLADGKYEEAVIAFTAAIEIDPKRAPAYVGRGDAYVGIGQLLMTGTAADAELPQETVSSYESAIADYLLALDLDESSAEVYLKAAEVYVALDDMDAAIGMLERGIQATKDEELQKYLEKLKQDQSERENDIITVSGYIIYNPNEYNDLWRQCEEKSRNNNDGTIYAMQTFGVRFNSPIHLSRDFSEIVLQEVEASNLDAHFDLVNDLYNSRTNSSGPMLGRQLEMTGYFIQRDPPGELIGPEHKANDSKEFIRYTYHPNGDYVFFIESYKLLD